MQITIEEAARRLMKGEVVAVPTETVYGLAASAQNPLAVSDIYLLKGRPSNNPLIIHLAKAEDLKSYLIEEPFDLERLTKAFWPGPLTLVLPIIQDKIPSNVRASLPTAAFRVPSHPLAKKLIEKTGPLVMPSANLSGSPSATCLDHIENDFGKHFPVLDGGPCAHGLESTILYWQKETKHWKLARLGAIAAETFKPVLGYVPEEVKVIKGKSVPLCPGQLYRHYAPKAKLILFSEIPHDFSGCVLGFEDRSYPKATSFISFGTSNDPETAANRLYAILRRLDQEGIAKAFVDVNFPSSGLWNTLKERLIKACGDS